MTAYIKHSAPELLNKAAAIMDERGKQYDKPDGERSMGRAVAAFNCITGRDLTEAEGWLLLQTLKDVRLWQRPGYHQDSAEDCIAYAALKAEAKQAERISQSKNVPAFLTKNKNPIPIPDAHAASPYVFSSKWPFYTPLTPPPPPPGPPGREVKHHG